MRYLDGVQLPFFTVQDRKALVGKSIKYLRECDIDKSGRGYFFPRVACVEHVKGVTLFDEFGPIASRGELVEIVEI